MIRIAYANFLRMRISHPRLIFSVSGQLLHAADSVIRLICPHMAVDVRFGPEFLMTVKQVIIRSHNSLHKSPSEKKFYIDVLRQFKIVRAFNFAGIEAR